MANERKQLEAERKKDTEALHSELQKLREENEKLRKLEETRAASVEQQARDEVYSNVYFLTVVI